jgi:hypothetical protein
MRIIRIRERLRSPRAEGRPPRSGQPSSAHHRGCRHPPRRILRGPGGIPCDAPPAVGVPALLPDPRRRHHGRTPRRLLPPRPEPRPPRSHRRRSNRACAPDVRAQRRTTSHSAGWASTSAPNLLAAPPATTTVVNSRPMPLRTHGPSCGVRTVRSASAASSPSPRRASSRLLIEVRDRQWSFRLWVVGAGRRQTALGVSRPECVCISVRARYTERLQWRSPRPPGMANHRAPPTTPAPNRH